MNIFFFLSAVFFIIYFRFEKNSSTFAATQMERWQSGLMRRS